MGYILTPTQTEKDNKLINNTLESLKTTNLLKQVKDTTTNPNLSTQNTQSLQLPQGKIPQTNTDSTKNPQNKQTQQNIGNAISMGSNVLSMQTNQNTLPQANNTTPHTNTNANNTQATQKPFNSQIALSSDKDFKPQSEISQATQSITPTPTKKSRLQREIESTRYATNFNQSAYTRNTTAFLGKPHEFSNHKLAMASKLRLLENFDNNANIDDEVFQRYNLIDNAVAALETAKKIHGENSKAYKDILDQYMQYGILRDNGIKDYASLAEFYNKGGNVGIKTEFKASENKEIGLDSVNAVNKQDNIQGKENDSIANFMQEKRDWLKQEKEKSSNDNKLYKHLYNTAMGEFDNDTNSNSIEQNKAGLSVDRSLALLGREQIDKALAQGIHKVNNPNKSSYKDVKDATQDDYNKEIAKQLKDSYVAQTWKDINVVDNFKEGNYLASVGNAAGGLTKLALDVGAETLKSTAENVASVLTKDAFKNKAELVLNENRLNDTENSTELFSKGSDADDFLSFVSSFENSLEASKDAKKIWDNETKAKLREYIEAKGSDKEDKAYEAYQQSLSKLQQEWDKSPAKVLANSDLISKAMTMKNQHDYGRFVFNLFKNPQENMELAQSYLNDLEYILKRDDNFKDVSEVALTKSGQIVVKRGNEYQALEQGFLESILHEIHDSFNEIGFSSAGAIAGLVKGMQSSGDAKTKARKAAAYTIGGGFLGAGVGAIIDEQINSWTTGYKNKDYGLKRAYEAATLNLAADIVLAGGGYGIKKGIEAYKNANLDGLSNVGNKVVSEVQKLANGNVNAVTNFLAKNALDQNERDAITQTAQKEFLNGRSLADYKSDVSIPKLERLKTAWQYEKFINKESMAKGKDKLEALSKEFESFQTTSMESNRPIMSLIQDMFEGKATRHEREKFLRFVSQNEALHSALSSVIAKNPTLALNFGKFIDKRANNVAKSIESEALTQSMFKDMDSSYAKTLKDRYGRVEFDIVRTLDNINFSDTGIKIHDILTDLKESIPHVTNAGQTINAMLQKLESRGIKSFNDDMIEFIEPKLNIDDLLNIRKYYNDILRSKDFKNASFKHLQAINKEIDSAIENALENIANKSGINTTKLLNNYKDINKEYADYAKFKESDFYKDSVKTKKREKDLSEDSFNKAILKQAQRQEGFNNKVFNRIANNTDKNLQAQAIKELIQRNIANPNGQFKAVKWQELIQDLEKIEHSITDEGLKGLITNLKQAQKLYHADNEFLQAAQRSIGSKPANVLISSASGVFGRTLLLFYNFVHKIMARFAGALSENLTHQSLENQLSYALRYARDTKDFIHVSIDSISKNMPKVDKETSKVLKELEYWKAQFEKDEIASFYTIKEAQETQTALKAHEKELQEHKEVIENALSEAKRDIETIQREVMESSLDSKSALSHSNNTLSYTDNIPNGHTERSEVSKEAQLDVSPFSKAQHDKQINQHDNTIKHDNFNDNEKPYNMEVEFDKIGMQEFQRKIESGEIQLDKPTQKTLENAYSQYNHLLQKAEQLEQDLQSFKGYDDNAILKTNSTLISQTQRVLNALQDDISFTKEAIKDIESKISLNSNKTFMPYNAMQHIEPKTQELNPKGLGNNLLIPTQTKRSFATNLMKQQETQALIPYNTNKEANNALIPYNTPQDTKLLAYNETKLLEYKETLHSLQKLEKSFKDFMSMPFSIIVDSKGNALPLTSQALKNFIFHNLYKEFLNTRHALKAPTLQLNFKPLHNEIKALPYKANANLKAHLKDINAKTNELLDSMHEFKKTTKEIKLLPYNKPTENKAVEADRFSNVLGDNFTTKPNNDKPITDYQVTMEVEPYVRDLAKLKGSEIYADLQNLVNKHREMFDKPSDAFKLIKEIKQNPEFFYNNNRLDAALIVKRLNDNKIGKMGVKKDDGEVIHATKVREKDLIRLKKVSDKFADSVGIIQTFTQQGSKNDKSLNGLPNNENNPTTKQQISKEIESKTAKEKETINASESIKEQSQTLHLENLDTTRFFETLNNMKGKKLNKKEKIALFENFAGALGSRQDMVVSEIERILKHAKKGGDKKYKDFSDLDEYAMNEVFFKVKNKDLYDDCEDILKDLKRNKDIDWDKGIFKELQNTEKGIALSNKLSSGIADDFAKVLKEWELDNNYLVNKFKNAIQSQHTKDTHAKPTTKQQISKEIESKSTQDIEKKARMKRAVYSVYYDDIMIDFRKKYDPDDDLWFMKHAKLEYSGNGEEVYAALKHLNEVRDNVSIKYDDYVAATEQVKNSLQRAALDIIDDFKASREAFEAIEKIQTKLLDDYPFNQKRDTIQKENGITQHTKDTHAKPTTKQEISKDATKENIENNYIQEVETIAKDFNLTDKEAIQGLINLKDEIGKDVNLLDSIHDKQNSKRLFDDLFRNHWLDFYLANEKTYKDISDHKALKEKISDIIFSVIQKENGITQHTKDTHAKPNTRDTEAREANTITKDKDTEKENSSTDNKHEATQRENGADTGWINTRTSNNLQENKNTETTLKRDNGISDEYAPSSKEMAQEWNEKVNEKGNLRDDFSRSGSDIETNAYTSRDTQGYNAGIRPNETDNKRHKHDGNNDRTNSRTGIHRNVSLKKKGKKDSNTNTESKVATQNTDTHSTPQVKPKKLSDKETPKTTKEIIKEAKASGKSVKETKKLVQKDKELSKKVTSKLSKDELDNLPIATQDELRGFLEYVEKKEYQNAPDVLKIATLNDELKSLLNHNNNANVFITKSIAGHISQNRKGQYNQALRMEEKLEIPQIINEAKTAYIGGGDGFVIPFADKINKDKINLIVLNSDEKGNFLITTKKVNTNDFNEGVYKEARAGVEPATTTLQNAEQKPTEAISLAKSNPTTKAEKSQKPKESPKELENIESESNPAGILNPEELATLNKEFKLGEIEDLKGQKALYEANIEALNLLDDILKSGRIASDDEKRILSNFRGFGKASNELYQVMKENGERLENLNNLLESLSEAVGVKVDANYLYRRAGDAYYTPTPIVESMVKLAKDLGLNNNHLILEPSSGSGRFLGQFHSNANVVGIELDPFTAKLSQTIYPYFKIDNAGFQNSKFAKDDFYDLVIGNPPYGSFTIRDEGFSASAHNYFMKRGIDKLKVGGISIQIVTKSFMDSSNDLVRKEIAKNAKFLGGVRLPNNAFKDASVTTDILVFKKVSATEAKKLDNSWIETTELNGIPVSKYFVDNPQNVLGEMKVGKGQFGDIVHVINKEGIDFSHFDLMPYLNKKYDFDTLKFRELTPTQIQEIESSLEELGKNKLTTFDTKEAGLVRYDREQDKFIKDDMELDLKEYLQSLEVSWKPETIEKRIAEYKELAPKISELQSTLKSLQKAELNPEADNEIIAALRNKLNSDYEAVVGKNGSFYTKDKKVSPRFKLFEMVDDISFEIFALEKAPLVKNNKVVGAEKADIFTKRVSYPYVSPQSADNLNDAMHISLNETGYNDYQRIADLLGTDVDSVKKEFLDNKLEYLDHNGERLSKDIFLSGDVKTRLESFHDEYGLPKFSDDSNISHYQKIAYEDLKSVMPDDIEVPHIEIPLGANWLDKNITDSFLSEIVGLDYLNTNYIHGAGWKVNFDGLKDRDFMIATGKDFKANTGVEYINGMNYIEDMLNNKTLVVQKTVTDKNGATTIYRDPIATQSLESLKKQLKREFKQYILENDSFSEIAQKQYNDTFNREVARKYNGSHLQLHGANSNIELRKHQKNAVYRFFQEVSSLLAHDVGTGKTYTMIASAIEGKRLKIHNKPMIVLPNHVAPQLAAEARRLYPNANIKLIQAVSRKDKNRALASLKNNNHDVIITTYTAFTNMNVAPSAFKNYINMEVKQLKNIYHQLEKSGEASKREINSIEKRIEKAEMKATNYAKSVANDKQNVFFEDLGIDTLMFDEAHYLKNLPIFTAQRNVRGIGQADSQRAIDAFMKISQMRDLPNNRILFATGTPITNFISDIYTLQKFLGHKDLEAKRIDVFDEWCKMFAGASSEFEMKATGEYKLTSRLRDFSNLPELKAMYYKFADLVTKEDMQKAILEEGGKIIEPKVKRIPVVLKRNQAQIDFMERVKKRAKILQDDPQAAMKKGGDNMLKIISDSNKASIDMRLIDSTYKRDENGKISAAANNILEVYNDFNEHKGTQLVFLDTSVPKKIVRPELLEKWEKELERLDSMIENQSHNMSENQLEKLRDKASDLESKIARGSDGFSAYNDLKDLLIEKGLKENEVAFVHDFDGSKKETLSQKINSGEIRVLIGSTSKMGAGSNFQERLAAIHHLDLDWTPANMEQREGRIIRQGNRLMDLLPDFEARIYTYVTEQMSDSLMLQTLEQKTKIIKQIQDPNIKARVIEDTSEDNLHGRLKAMTSPNAEQELEAMNIVKSIGEVENAISTHDLILKNNKNKIESSTKLEASLQHDIDRLVPFKKQTQENTTISFGKEKINFAKDNKAKTSKDNKTDTTKATKDKDKQKDTQDKDKKKEKSPESLANEKLNTIIQDFAKSSDKVKVICEYRGLNLLAQKGHRGIDFYLGEDLKEAFSIATSIDIREAAYYEKNYMQRFNNGYNKLISDEYIKELQGQMQKARDTKAKALKAYEKESANKESVAGLRNSLNEMLVRQAELHSFLGRADENEIERLKAIYGDDFENIVNAKFGKKETELENKQHKIPTKSKVEKDLSTDEIRQIINTWDLNNPKKSDKLIISKVDEAELELLAKDFDFKGNYAVAREIDSEHLAHALNRHGDESNAANIAITKDEVVEFYPKITKQYDSRIVTDNNTIIYSKQINGHFIVIEEVLTGRNKLRFDTAWKQKGKLNEKVLFKNAKVFPNAK